MKHLKTIITVIAISLSTVFSVNATDKKPPVKDGIEFKSLSKEVGHFIGNKISLEIKEATDVHISFIVNNSNEIVVLSVDSNNPNIHTFIKNKLNYKKVKTKDVRKGEVYKFNLKINVR